MKPTAPAGWRRPDMMWGNHSYNHPLFDKIPIEECVQEVEMTQEIIHKELGFYPTLLRPPAGKTNRCRGTRFSGKRFRYCHLECISLGLARPGCRTRRRTHFISGGARCNPSLP